MDSWAAGSSPHGFRDHEDPGGDDVWEVTEHGPGPEIRHDPDPDVLPELVQGCEHPRGPADFLV